MSIYVHSFLRKVVSVLESKNIECLHLEKHCYLDTNFEKFLHLLIHLCSNINGKVDSQFGTLPPINERKFQIKRIIFDNPLTQCLEHWRKTLFALLYSLKKLNISYKLAIFNYFELQSLKLN